MNTTKTQNLLKIAALALILVGALTLILRHAVAAALPLAAGAAGAVGLALHNRNALLAYTAFAWATVALAAVEIAQLVSHPADPLGWLVWLATAIAALPAAVLSSTLHVLDVWPRSAVVSEHAAPLVGSQESAGLQAVLDYPKRPSTLSSPPPPRPVWPPQLPEVDPPPRPSASSAPPSSWPPAAPGGGA